MKLESVRRAASIRDTVSSEIEKALVVIFRQVGPHPKADAETLAGLLTDEIDFDKFVKLLKL